MNEIQNIQESGIIYSDPTIVVDNRKIVAGTYHLATINCWTIDSHYSF